MELVIVLILLALLGLGALLLYNNLATGRLQVREAWSTVGVQLQRRGDLIPNLVETVKGYAAHERETFDRVTRARAMLQSAATPGQAAQANNMLTQALRSLFAVAEAYPALKANQNFLALQEQLKDTEDKIAYARTYYNARVLQYNTRVATLPSALVARVFRFTEEEFFEAPETAEEPVRVSFS